jgi:hypothetical protein
MAKKKKITKRKPNGQPQEATRVQHIEARVEPAIEGTTPRYFANQMAVQHTGSEFLVSFFQLFPPLLQGTAEEKRKQLDELGAVSMPCVAQVIISPERMEEFIAALRVNLDRFRQIRAGVDDDADSS